MHTENTIWIEAEPVRVFELAVDIARWPELLPHYRWVRILEQRPREQLAEMSARRSLFPVKWTSVQQQFPGEGRICYQHVRGTTTGMAVEWRLTRQNGGTQVTIVHDLMPRQRLLRNGLAKWIIGEFF